MVLGTFETTYRTVERGGGGAPLVPARSFASTPDLSGSHSLPLLPPGSRADTWARARVQQDSARGAHDGAEPSVDAAPLRDFAAGLRAAADVAPLLLPHQPAGGGLGRPALRGPDPRRPERPLHERMAQHEGRGALPPPTPDWDTELALSLVHETKPSYDLKTRGKTPLSEDHLLALVDQSLLPSARRTASPHTVSFDTHSTYSASAPRHDAYGRNDVYTPIGSGLHASYAPPRNDAFSSQLRVETNTTTYSNGPAPQPYAGQGAGQGLRGASDSVAAAFDKFDADTLLGDLKDNHQSARARRSPSAGLGNAMEREPYYSPGNCTKGELINLIANPPSRGSSRPRSVSREPAGRGGAIGPTNGFDTSAYGKGAGGGGGGGASLSSPGGRPLNSGYDSLSLTMLDTSANRPTGYMCGACKESINQRQPGCTALNQMFHIACFRCVACDEKLAGASFYAVDGKPYCEKDYVNTLDHCSICQKPITDRILRAAGKAYHPGCFTCSVCSKGLDSVPFTVDNNNRIHCVPCFHDKYAPRCAICSGPIIPKEGEEGSLRVVALDRSYHVECYKCEDCSMRLSSKIPGQECYPLDDHLYCKNCNLTHLRNLTA